MTMCAMDPMNRAKNSKRYPYQYGNAAEKRKRLESLSTWIVRGYWVGLTPADRKYVPPVTHLVPKHLRVPKNGRGARKRADKAAL